MLILMQPRIKLAFQTARAHCRLMSSLPSITTLHCKSALHPYIPQLVTVVPITQVQDLVFLSVEPHEVHLGPLLHVL